MKKKWAAGSILIFSALVIAAVLFSLKGIISREALTGKVQSMDTAYSRYVSRSKAEENDSLQMSDKDRGWRTHGKNLYRTSDGGKTWLAVPFPIENKDQNLSFSFPDADTAFAVFSRPVSGKSNTADTCLASTDNAGKTFQVMTLSGSLPADNPQNSRKDTLFFSDRQTGYLSMTEEGAMGHCYLNIYTTSNAGHNWRLISSGVRTLDGESAVLVFTDRLHGYHFVKQGGAYPYELCSTANGGAKWNVFSPRLSYKEIAPALTPVYMTPNERIALLTCQNGSDPLHPSSAGGSDSRIYNFFFHLSSDGGMEEKVADLVTDYPLDDRTVSFPDALHGFCMASIDGKVSVYAYTAAGKKWDAVGEGPWMKDVSKLQFINSETGFALCGDALYQTQDGGVSWNPCCKIS